MDNDFLLELHWPTEHKVPIGYPSYCMWCSKHCLLHSYSSSLHVMLVSRVDLNKHDKNKMGYTWVETDINLTSQSTMPVKKGTEGLTKNSQNVSIYSAPQISLFKM